MSLRGAFCATKQSLLLHAKISELAVIKLPVNDGVLAQIFTQYSVKGQFCPHNGRLLTLPPSGTYGVYDVTAWFRYLHLHRHAHLPRVQVPGSARECRCVLRENIFDLSRFRIARSFFKRKHLI
jgi:hypothetical protein